MLTHQQIDQFSRDGYLAGPKVLDEDDVAVLQAEIERIIRDRDKGGRQPVLCRNLSGPDTPVWQIVNIWEASDPFARLLRHPGIVSAVAQLTGSPLRIWHDQVQYKPAARGGVNMWHQDHPYWPVLRPASEVTAWVALDDVDESNGCMSMVPGSHQWGDCIGFLHTLKAFDQMPREFEGRKIDIRLCPVRRGHVHFHHGMTWHGSHANTSGRPRRAVALHYMPSTTLFVASGQHVMKQFIHVPDGHPIEGDRFPLVSAT